MNEDLNATVSNVKGRTSNKVLKGVPHHMLQTQQQQQRQSRDTVQQQQCTEPSQIGRDEGNGAAPPPQAATDAETANDDNGVPTPGKQPCSSGATQTAAASTVRTNATGRLFTSFWELNTISRFQVYR
uniref:Uncharacterized protein n=1 Tax=Anopheles merus TaxID=30066 RepID=A0A182VBI8_ANOME